MHRKWRETVTILRNAGREIASDLIVQSDFSAANFVGGCERREVDDDDGC